MTDVSCGTRSSVLQKPFGGNVGGGGKEPTSCSNVRWVQTARKSAPAARHSKRGVSSVYDGTSTEDSRTVESFCGWLRALLVVYWSLCVDHVQTATRRL